MEKPVNPSGQDPTLADTPGFNDNDDALMKAREALNVEYTDVETDPQLGPIFQDVRSFADEWQSRFGAPAKDLPSSDVRLFTPDNLQEVGRLIGLEPGIPGVYDARTDTIFMQEPHDKDSPTEKLGFAYMMAHEVGHKLTSKLWEFENPDDESYILKEGIADEFARDFIRNAYMPKHVPDFKDKISHTFGPNGHYALDENAPIAEEDILFINPESGNVSMGSYVDERKILANLARRIGPQAYQDVMIQATTGSMDGIKDIVCAKAGSEVWDLISTTSWNRPSRQEVGSVRMQLEK